MKLVELLARELVEWPEGVAIAAQDSDRVVCFNLKASGFFFLHGEWRDSMARAAWLHSEPMPILATDHATAIVTREMWEAERAKLAAGAEWNGEGLPPVGAVCEVEVYEQEWFKCTVVAHHEGRAVIVLANKESAHIVNASQLRPSTRTPEQIAAQEREVGAREMIDAVKKGRYTKHGISHDAALALFDAGYRKQEK